MSKQYTKPKVDSAAFNCPFCYVYANFHWSWINVSIPTGGATSIDRKAAQCQHCKKWSLWASEVVGKGSNGAISIWRMVYPEELIAPLPSQDMPAICKSDYLEARQVLAYSPRSSAALLRLCIQKLCKEFGEDGKNINGDIASLVKKGLDPRIQKALDIVRVTGNNAVHPGEMNLNDNPEIAEKLFKLTNMIVEEMITKPNELDSLYGELPDKARVAIEKRDN